MRVRFPASNRIGEAFISWSILFHESFKLFLIPERVFAFISLYEYDNISSIAALVNSRAFVKTFAYCRAAPNRYKETAPAPKAAAVVPSPKTMSARSFWLSDLNSSSANWSSPNFFYQILTDLSLRAGGLVSIPINVSASLNAISGVTRALQSIPGNCLFASSSSE